MAAYGLNVNSTTPDFVRAMAAMYAENVIQANKIRELEARLGSSGEKQRDWLEPKSFQAVDKFDGSEKDSGNWEFQFQRECFENGKGKGTQCYNYGRMARE